jgi:haloacetate dehalogenase
MFENFTERYVEGAGAKLFLRQGGNISGPPLLLLHGYPQTSAMWDSVASILAIILLIQNERWQQI